MESRAVGVYVHVPFCAARCDYCDFATWVAPEGARLIDDYVGACCSDIDRRVANGELTAADTVFFGGGTPSLLDAAALVSILERIPRAPGAEVTVECNPDTVDDAKLAAYRAGGVTRISLGVQSMAPHVLAALGRTHDPVNVERAVGAIRRVGFETFNLDLIYGTPGETLDDWHRTLEGALALEPPHVSAYALTVEPATPLGKRVAAGEPAPDDDDQAVKYELADELLSAAGLDWYEVSNWARPGHECRHNLHTWRGGDYLAIGCAAHGHRGGHRWWNVRSPERYVERIAAGADPVAGEEHLDAPVRADETFTLALRTRTGAPIPPGADATADELAGLGLVERRGGHVVLTRAGRLLASDVTARLLCAARGAPASAGTRYH